MGEIVANGRSVFQGMRPADPSQTRVEPFWRLQQMWWKHNRISLFSIAFLLLVGGCQGTPEPTAAIPSPPAPTAADTSPKQVAPDPSFVAWVDQFRNDARKRGISEETIAAALGDVAPIPRVIELDRRQPEFSQTFWRYVTSAVTEKRVAAGREHMQKHAALLATLEETYGVPGRFLVAFWGRESDYGRDSGSYSVIGATATLAHEGRRGQMFRDELLNALTILDRGHISLGKMKGSWAGAMGQTQFMPSNFLRYAVDQDGDGRKDVWNSVPDALGSAANYLKALGWDGKRTWGREVKLPPKFDANLASLDIDALEIVKPLAAWAALGVKRADGGPLPKVDANASIILPAGINGPAFLVYDDYRAILKWNRSTFYAVSVGYLADRLAGAGPLAAAPRDDNPLKRDEVIALQRSLITLGFLKLEPDGIVGSTTRQAVRAFQRSAGLPPDGYIDGKLIAAVKSQAPPPNPRY